MNDLEIRKKLRTIEKDLKNVSKELLSNPAFLLEIGKIVRESTGELFVDVSNYGNRVVITEDFETKNRLDTKEYNGNSSNYMGRSRTIDNSTEMQNIKCKNHSLELLKDSCLIVNHQGASMDRNMEFNNQQSNFKYGLLSSLYNGCGVEINRVFYIDSDQITSGKDDSSFNIDRLYREASSRVPSIKYSDGGVVFKPSKFNSNADVTFIIRDNNYQGIAKYEKRQYSSTRGIGEKIVSSGVYQINSDNPGLLEIDESSYLLDSSMSKEELARIVIEKNNEFMTSGSNGYGSDIIGVKKSNIASI